MPVPHMGWSRVDVRDRTIRPARAAITSISRTALPAIRVPRRSPAPNTAEKFPPVMRHRNWLGAQFHPERSARCGRTLSRGIPRMIIYPAMDLMGGRVVRLKQGRFDDATHYPAAPAEALRQFAEAGAEWAHVVDLDGARGGAAGAARADRRARRFDAAVRLQVAGGFRKREHLARMFDAGVARVVVGSLAVKDPEHRTPLDRRIRPRADRACRSMSGWSMGRPFVASGGWTEDSGQSLWDVASLYPHARHFLVTDIGRDGMLEGPNVGLLRRDCMPLARRGRPGVGGHFLDRRPRSGCRPTARSSARRCGKATFRSKRHVGLARA